MCCPYNMGFFVFFFIPQNCLNLFIHTISCFLKTFLFDNSFHSPIMAEILARCPHNAVNCQIFKLSLSRSFPPPPLHLNTANNIKIDRRLEKVTLSLESKILFDDVVRTTHVVSNVNLANFTQVMYNIIKKNILKKVVASQKVFHKIALISLDFSKLNCGRYLDHRQGEKDFSVATSRIKGFVPATVVRKTWGVRLLFVWVLQHMPYLWAAAAAPIQCVKITFVRKFSQFLMSKNKDYCAKRVPWAPSVVGTTSNFLSFHMLILNFSPNTNSKLSFKLIKACKTTAVMFKLNHKLVKKDFQSWVNKKFSPIHYDGLSLSEAWRKEELL